LFHYGHNPIAFVVLTGIVFFAWGEIYSLFPSTCADTFGSKFASANAGLLYTAKGTASLLVPLSAVLASAAGGWYAVFVLASILNATAALMAWFVLKPMRAKHMSKAAIGE
jgi:MFS transporter, OFA family, oxalate/formate antiporter